MADVLRERYERLCGTWSDVQDHLPTFVEAVDRVEATKVIELGVRYGVSTIAWLYALRNRGHLWSVDCSFPVPATPEDINLLDPQGDLGVQRHWTFVLGYDVWPEVLDALPDKADIVFIDTNHVYEETLEELKIYYPRVREGGLIFLHDTAIETTGNATTEQPPFPVLTAVKEFCSEHNLKWEHNPKSYGLGTIYC